MSKEKFLQKETTLKEVRPAQKAGFFGATNGGHKITPITQKKKKLHLPKTMFVKTLVRELGGYKPYELRIVDLLKSPGANVERRARKMARKKLGDYKRATKKVSELSKLIKEGKL
eukprot:GAHX01000212.1.p1 GENE.GAHX01000212.1~~GAHX01000212.1.p1  ORF type:complete len:115 (-),score=26.82 GAHX01000212.1:34-378(-)